MRNILAIGLFIIACLFVVSCKEEDTSLQGKMGYLRLATACGDQGCEWEHRETHGQF